MNPRRDVYNLMKDNDVSSEILAEALIGSSLRSEEDCVIDPRPHRLRRRR
jgi:hypothetical protein